MEGMLMLLVMMIITMVLTWALNGEQRKRAVSLLLCAALMSSYIPAINVARADSAGKPVLVNEQVLVNGTKTTQIGAVTYSSSGSAYTLDTSSARVRVKNGDSISFEGAISAPEGETISWVRVDVYDASTEEPYTVGAEYYRADGLKVQQYDLSNIPALTIGEAFGRKGYTLAEGGKYIVMFCVGDSNGNTFADMDAVIEDNQGPAILVDVKLSPSNCKHPHSDYVYILHSSGEVRKQSYGDSMTHQVEPLYERYCGLCDTFLMNIWGEGTSEEHSMDSNGVCLGCGYCVEPMMPLTYAARISSLEFTSPNDGDEVQVGEFVTVEWEKKDGTEEYVVYVKLLDGEPDNGSDNEIGTLLDNQQNWKYTEYTMVIPENAAGKWIKFNVHGKTSAGEQTEAASSLYIYVRSDEYEEDPTTCTHEYSEDVIDKECYDRGNYAFHWYCEEIEYYCSKCGDTYTEWTTEDDQVYEEHTWNSENSTCIDCECVLPKLTMDYFTIEDNYKVGDVFSFAGEINGNESNISRVSINVKKPSADSEVHLSTVDVNSFTYNLWDVADIELDEAGEYGIFIWAVDAAGNGLNSDDAEAGTGTFVYWFTVDEPLPPTMTEDLSVSPKVVMQGESVSISGMVAGTEGSKLKNIQVSVFDHDDPQKGGIVYREENLTDTYWYNLNEIQIDTDAVYGNLEMGIGVYDVVLYVTDEYGLGLEDTPMVTFEVIAQEENALYIDSHQELTEVNVGEYYTISWSNGNSYAYVAETVVLDGEPAYNENEAGTSSGTIRLDDDSFSGVIDSNQAGKYLKIIIYGVDESGSVSQDADYVYFYVNPVESGSPIIENLVIDESVPEGGSIYVGGTVKGIGAALTDVAIAIRSAEDETMGGYLAQYGSFYTDSFELGYAYQTGVTVGNLFLGEGEYIVEVYATDENGNGFAERQYGNLTITPHDPTYGVSILSHNYYGQIEENEEVTVSWLDGYSDRYVVNVMYLDGDPTAGDPDTGTSVATNVIVEGGSYTFTAPDVDAEDKWVKFSVYGIQSDSMDVMEYESTVYLRTVPAASKPTIENFAASETEVSVGDTISLSGVINGNGTQLRAVQVSVFEHDNHVNGVVFYHSGSIFMDEFDLSAVEEIPVGEPVGETDFVMTEGQYDIVLYATNADGNGFESDPTITVTVVEREKASVNVEIEEDSVFVGDSISLNGEASGGDYYLKKVQVSVFTDDSGTCGYYDVSKEFAQGEAKTFDLSELGEIAIRESFTCNAHGVEEKFPAGEAKITVYMSVYDGEGASASDYVTVEVPEKEGASISVAVNEDSVEVGNAITLDGTVDSGDYYLKKVQVSVFTDDSGSCGYYDVSREFAEGEAQSFELSGVGEVIIKETFTCNAHGVEETFPAGEAKITVYMSVYDGEGASASDYVTVTEKVCGHPNVTWKEETTFEQLSENTAEYHTHHAVVVTKHAYCNDCDLTEPLDTLHPDLYPPQEVSRNNELHQFIDGVCSDYCHYEMDFVPECEHLNKVIDESSIVVENQTENEHTISYWYFCNDCQTLLNNVVREENTAAHTFDENDVCTVCGYTENELSLTFKADKYEAEVNEDVVFEFEMIGGNKVNFYADGQYILTIGDGEKYNFDEDSEPKKGKYKWTYRFNKDGTRKVQFAPVYKNGSICIEGEKAAEQTIKVNPEAVTSYLKVLMDGTVLNNGLTMPVSIGGGKGTQLTVDSSGKWSVKADASWIKVAADAANNLIQHEYEANYSGETRTGKITVSAPGCADWVITCTQDTAMWRAEQNGKDSYVYLTQTQGGMNSEHEYFLQVYHEGNLIKQVEFDEASEKFLYHDKLGMVRGTTYQMRVVIKDKQDNTLGRIPLGDIRFNAYIKIINVKSGDTDVKDTTKQITAGEDIVIVWDGSKGVSGHNLTVKIDGKQVSLPNERNITFGSSARTVRIPASVYEGMMASDTASLEICAAVLGKEALWSGKIVRTKTADTFEVYYRIHEKDKQGNIIYQSPRLVKAVGNRIEYQLKPNVNQYLTVGVQCTIDGEAKYIQPGDEKGYSFRTSSSILSFNNAQTAITKAGTARVEFVDPNDKRLTSFVVNIRDKNDLLFDIYAIAKEGTGIRKEILLQHEINETPTFRAYDFDVHKYIRLYAKDQYGNILPIKRNALSDGNENAYFRVIDRNNQYLASQVEDNQAYFVLSSKIDNTVYRVELILDEEVVATANLMINGRKYYEDRYQITCDQIDEVRNETYYSYCNGNAIDVKFSAYDHVTGRTIELSGNNMLKLDVISEADNSEKRINTGEIKLSPGTYSLVLNYYRDEGGFLPKEIIVDNRNLIVGKRKNEILEDDLINYVESIKNWSDIRGGYDLADEILKNSDSDTAVIIKSMVGLEWLIKQSVYEATGNNQFDSEYGILYDALMEIFKNMPDTDTSIATELQEVIDPDLFKYVYTGEGEVLTVGDEYQVKQSDIVKLLKYATGMDLNETKTQITTEFFDYLLGDGNFVSKILGFEHTDTVAGILTEGAKKAIEQQIIHATIQMNQLDILIGSITSGPEGDKARAVLEDIKSEYAQEWIATMQSVGKSIGVAAFEKGAEWAIEKLLDDMLGAPYKAVTFARDIGLGVTGLKSYADAEFNCLAIEAYLLEIEGTLYNLIENRVTDERLIDTYDLWRAAMIAKMEQAKMLTSDESVKAELEFEIEQIKAMTIDKWHVKEERQYYWGTYVPNDGELY